jgi:endonuclease/exonuclease/phosphatase family metal-dependent hydrolase
MAKNQLTVLDYNIWHGLNPTSPFKFGEFETEQVRAERLDGFYKQVRALNPDVIFLQEVNPTPGLSKKIAQELGYDHVYLIDNAGLKFGSVGLPTNLRSGLTTLARKELNLKKLGGKKLSGPPGGCSRALSIQFTEFRYCLAAKITVNGHDWMLLNTHLHHGLEVTDEMRTAIDDLVEAQKLTRPRANAIIAQTEEATARRQSELKTAVEFARSLGMDGMPTLFAGDFNATPGAPELNWLTQDIEFTSATKDDDPETRLITWDPDLNENIAFVGEFRPVNEFESFIMDHLKPIVLADRRRLDYIFFREFEGIGTVRESGLFGDELYKGRMSSDHFGIWTRFELVP